MREQAHGPGGEIEPGLAGAEHARPARACLKRGGERAEAGGRSADPHRALPERATGGGDHAVHPAVAAPERPGIEIGGAGPGELDLGAGAFERARNSLPGALHPERVGGHELQRGTARERLREDHATPHPEGLGGPRDLPHPRRPLTRWCDPERPPGERTMPPRGDHELEAGKVDTEDAALGVSGHQGSSPLERQSASRRCVRRLGLAADLAEGVDDQQVVVPALPRRLGGVTAYPAHGGRLQALGGTFGDEPADPGGIRQAEGEPIGMAQDEPQIPRLKRRDEACVGDVGAGLDTNICSHRCQAIVKSKHVVAENGDFAGDSGGAGGGGRFRQRRPPRSRRD